MLYTPEYVHNIRVYTYRAVRIPTVDVQCKRLKWVDGKLNLILYCLLDFLLCRSVTPGYHRCVCLYIY